MCGGCGDIFETYVFPENEIIQMTNLLITKYIQLITYVSRKRVRKRQRVREMKTESVKEIEKVLI